MENFDLKLYQVSKQGQDIIDRLFEQPNLEITYDQDIVKNNKILFDFLVNYN